MKFFFCTKFFSYTKILYYSFLFFLFGGFIMDVNSKMNFIARNTQEIVTKKEFRELLEKEKKPVVYWGTAPTGKVHVGYYIPMIKLADFVRTGFKVKVLIADLHAHLDDLKTPWELLEHRSKYYELCVKAMLKSLGVNLKQIKFVRGSDFQLTPNYSRDLLRLVAIVTLNRSRRAASEVVRFKEDPKLGGFIYPLMQTLDVPYLEADVAFGGVDQRGIYMLSREILPEIGYKKPICVFNPMLPGLTGEKMSASVKKSKIDLLDSEEEVEMKINSAYCPKGIVEKNGVLAFVEHVIFPIKDNVNETFLIERSQKFGGNLEYKNYSELVKDYRKGVLHPLDLKKAVAREINVLLKVVRKEFENKKELVKKAYPEEE